MVLAPKRPPVRAEQLLEDLAGVLPLRPRPDEILDRNDKRRLGDDPQPRATRSSTVTCSRRQVGMAAGARTPDWMVPACAVLAGRVPAAMLVSTLPVFRRDGGGPEQSSQEGALRRLIRPA
jgi:hypothetical protein